MDAVPLPEVWLVIWNGVLMELESVDAIAFREADARAIVAASPGRGESYSVEARDLAVLLTSPPFALLADRLRRQCAAGDTTPVWLRTDAERNKRGA